MDWTEVSLTNRVTTDVDNFRAQEVAEKNGNTSTESKAPSKSNFFDCTSPDFKKSGIEIVRDS